MHRTPISTAILLLVAIAPIIANTALAQTPYQPPQVQLLEDPFGRDAPPRDGTVPPVRPDPIPAYEQFPSRWKLMQRQLCDPVFDQQTGKVNGWQCRMADGTIEFIR